MKYCKLTWVTMADLLLTLFLCAGSFLSDFTQQLIAIFLMSFIARFYFNYFFISQEGERKNLQR